MTVHAISHATRHTREDVDRFLARVGASIVSHREDRDGVSVVLRYRGRDAAGHGGTLLLAVEAATRELGGARG